MNRQAPKCLASRTYLSGFCERSKTPRRNLLADFPNLTALCTFKHVGTNILIYEAQYTMGDPTTGPWTDIEPFSTSRHFEIPGLQRAKDVWVRVRARNSNGPGPWSDPATTLVN